MRRTPIPVVATVRTGLGDTLGRFRESIVIVLLVQGAIAVVAAPLLVAVFDLAVHTAGLRAVTDTSIGQLFRNPIGVIVLICSLALTLATLLIQAVVFFGVADDRALQRTPTVRRVAGHALGVGRRLLRQPSTLLLVPYAIVLVPLGHIGGGSVLTRWVAIPQFVTDELLKEPLYAALYYGLLAAIGYVNLRLSFTIPILVLSDRSAAGALAESWRVTRWGLFRVIGILLGVAIPGFAAVALIAGLGLGAAALSDALTPQASPVVAAIAIGCVEVASFIIIGLVLLAHARAFVAVLYDVGALRAAQPQPAALPPTAASAPTAAMPQSAQRRLLAAIAAGGAAIAVVVLAVQAYPAVAGTSRGSSVVIAHRGFTAGGVENTIPALDAANAAGADVVEMDVQQTADGGWVLMHDMNLRRLAGRDEAVKDLTLAQATAITVRADGLEAKIPSLEEYLTRAADLDQQLLIEVKVHGGESRDYLDGLLALLERTGGAGTHIYHTLSADVVKGLTERRPDLTIGYIVPLAFGGVPATPAGFLVLEQGAYSDGRMDEIHTEAKSTFVWTVQTDAEMRRLFEDGVDAVITDHPDRAVAVRNEVAGQTGVVQRLADALDRSLAWDW